MSRGTRVGGDVMGIIPEDEEEEEELESYPEEISFPKSFSPGAGRIWSLNDQLRRVYEGIAASKNKITRAQKGYDKAARPMVVNRSALAMFEDQKKEGQGEFYGFEATAKTLIAELRAVGGKPFSVDFVTPEEVPAAFLVPNGSLSYLCNPLHYFAEEISVPKGLPTVCYEFSFDPKGVAEFNKYLQMKYNVLAKSVNRICYFRHQRLTLGFDSGAHVPFSRLRVEIPESRELFDSVVGMIRDEKPRYGDQIFLMPTALRDKILEDHALINHSELPDISCLYPEGIPDSSPIRNGNSIYVLIESAMGYSLFRAINTSSAPTLSNFETFKSESGVKLIEHYPFQSQAIAIEEFQHIKNDTCSPMLKLFLEMYLPALKAWSWNSIKLGVRNKKFGLAIKSTTGITCRRKHHFLKELRGGIEQFLHLFLEIEQIELKEAQQALDNKLEDDQPQE